MVTERFHPEANGDNRREAEKLGREIEAEIRAGTFDYARRLPDSRHVERLGLRASVEPTFGEFAAQWFGEKVGLTDATQYD